MQQNPKESDTHKLARLLLDEEPGQWIHRRRLAGVSWRRIASEVAVETKGELLVDEATVTNWGKAWAAANAPDPAPAA